MRLLPRYRKAELAIIALVLLFYSLNRFTTLFSGDFASYHLNDLLCGVLFPAYANIVLSLSRYRFRFDTLPRTLALGLFLSIGFEIIAPLLLSYSTPDLLDAACYIVGCLIHLVIIKVVPRESLYTLSRM